MRESILSRLDQEAIVNSILTCKRGDGTENQISAVAKEMALNLVQGWAEKYADVDFNGPRIVAVEAPFYIWVDDRTLTVGVQDRILEGVIGNEWKTKAPPTSKRWSEASWFDDMANGVQLATYALGIREGNFIQDGKQIYFTKTDAPVSISVRAALKQVPPAFWPTQPKTTGTFTFSQVATNSMKNALIQRGNAIRAMRTNPAIIPWQHTGSHCFRQYGKTCPWFEKYCKEGKHPASVPSYLLTPGDPGTPAAKFALDGYQGDVNEVVVLSQSLYERGTTCAEALRIESGHIDREPPNEDLDIGTGFHAGIAELNRQIMRLQGEK